MKKIVLFILLIISFFNLLTLNGYCVEILPSAEEVVDSSEAVYNQYDSMNRDMLTRMYYSQLYGNALSSLTAFNNLLYDYNYSYFISYNTYDGSAFLNSFSYNQSTMWVVFYQKSNNTTIGASYDNWCLINTPVIKMTLPAGTYYRFRLTDNNFVLYDTVTTLSSINIYLPKALYNYTPSSTIQYLTAKSVSDSVALEQIAENTAAASEQAQATNDFLTNKNVDNNSYNQSSTNIPDSSSSDLTGAFTTLKNVFTNNQSVDIVIPIPYSEENLTIPSNMTVTMLGENGQFLVNLVSLIFNFALATFIVKDVNKYITRLKDGSIVEGTDTNIKADML